MNSTGLYFWLTIGLNSALDVLVAYGDAKTLDPELATKMQAASTAIKDCLNYVFQQQTGGK